MTSDLLNDFLTEEETIDDITRSLDLEMISDLFWAGRNGDREQAIQDAMDWSIWAFLHYKHAQCGAGRNHEIAGYGDFDELRSALIDSADRMQRNPKRTIEMRPPCWWNVQKHHHELERNEIHRIAERVHYSLLLEAINRLVAQGDVRYEHGYWLLSATTSEKYIRQMKHTPKRRAAQR